MDAAERSTESAERPTLGVALTGSTSRRVLPGLVLFLAAAIGIWYELPVVGPLCLMVLMVVTPIAGDLASRVIVSLAAALAGSALALQLPITWGKGALVGVAAVALSAHLGVAMARPTTSLRPRLGALDGLVLAGAALTATLLALPWFGSDADDLLLDLARGADHLGHYAMVADLLDAQSANWVSLDGTKPVFDAYQFGYQALLAAILAAGGAGQTRVFVWPFAVLILASLAVAVCIFGWISVRVSAGLASEKAKSRGLVMVGLFTALSIAGGSFSAPFEIGHSPFLLLAATGAGASWLVLEWAPHRR